MKLIPMSTFVISQWDKDISREEFAQSCIKYATFLKTPLSLGMFVPCNEDGIILSEPESIGVGNQFYYERALDQYDEAKEKVIFEGFEIQKQGGEFLVKYQDKPVWVNWNNSKTIEDLVYLGVDCAVSF